MRNWLAILCLAVCVGLTAPNLMADKGQGKGKGKGTPHVSGDSHGNKHKDHDGWERREGYEYRIYGDHDGRPPGWSQGKKTGWDNCGLPPGQAKKYGCRTYVYEGRRHYYYQDEVGRIIIRRPVISVGADIR